MQRDDDEELEDNPAMGWRALRLALDRDGLMKAQARALFETATAEYFTSCPMVSEPWEYEQARALVEHQRLWLQERKKKLPIAVDGSAGSACAGRSAGHIAAAASFSCRSAPMT